MTTVIFSGHMTKRGSRFPTWKKRYFEICDDGLLTYYASQGGDQKGTFQFDKWTVIAPSCFFDDNMYGFCLRGNMKCLHVRMEVEADKNRWVFEPEQVLKRIKAGELILEKSYRSISDVDIDNSLEMASIDGTTERCYST
jgi:hypothetical protein